jgi:N-acetylneuraminate synthase
MPNAFKIGNRWIGAEHPPVVIAEMGINHGGSLDLAIEIADAAIARVLRLSSIKRTSFGMKCPMRRKSVIPGHTKESIYEIMETCALGEEDEFKLMKHIQSKGCIFSARRFPRRCDRLAKFDVPAYKIGSASATTIRSSSISRVLANR